MDKRTVENGLDYTWKKPTQAQGEHEKLYKERIYFVFKPGVEPRTFLLWRDTANHHTSTTISDNCNTSY